MYDALPVPAPGESALSFLKRNPSAMHQIYKRVNQQTSFQVEITPAQTARNGRAQAVVSGSNIIIGLPIRGNNQIQPVDTGAASAVIAAKINELILLLQQTPIIPQ